VTSDINVDVLDNCGTTRVFHLSENETMHVSQCSAKENI
jgi:hypothetical protein